MRMEKDILNSEQNSAGKFVSVIHINSTNGPEDVFIKVKNEQKGRIGNNLQLSCSVVEPEVETLDESVYEEIENRNNSEANFSLSDESLDSITTSSTNSQKEAAVIIRKAWKSYGDKGVPVLSNFNMTVERGTIYSLLGSSGCGKTTVLTCMVGIRNLSSGEIFVFGSRPGTKECGVPGKRVGYMPQDVALYHDFSIHEMVRYYGTLYDMSGSSIRDKQKFLIDFLELPDGSRRISTLSGGQKRRVSLAVSLIHSPELLILDEPTVGVDPLLRESIWSHLCHLVKTQNTTVIITTHYIEEARHSKTVGLMRGGKLLVEKNPELMIREHNGSCLEDVVLQFCRKDKQTHQNVNSEEFSSIKKADSDGSISSCSMESCRVDALTTHCYEAVKDASGIRNSITRIQALAMKNITVIRRNLILLLFLIIVPSMQLIFVCTTVGNDPMSLSVGFINYETTFENNTKCALDKGHNSSSDCYIQNLSCQYLSAIPPDIVHLIEYKTESEASKAITEGKIWGYMIFQVDYSQSLLARIKGLQMNETLESSHIYLEMDMSNKQIGQTLKRVFYDTYQKFINMLLLNCGFPPALGESPLKYLPPVYGTDDTDFTAFIAPSSLLGAVFFFSLCSSSISYIWDKKQGTMERAMVAGVQTWEIMTAFFITETCMLLVQLGIVFLLFKLVFGIEILGSTFLALLLAVIMGLSGVSMGFLIGSFCNEEMEAVLLVMAAFFPNCLLTGTIWPIEGLPVPVQYLTYLLPCTLANESIRSIVSRGWGLSHIKVWPGFVTTTAWICIYWIISIHIRRKSLSKK